MGKVGSRSVCNGLEYLHLGVPVYHCHCLNDLDALEARMLQRLPHPDNGGPNGTLAGIRASKKIFEEFSADRRRWHFIAMTRDPVARNVSAFFQGILERIPDFYEQVETGVDWDRVTSAFVADEITHRCPLVWFDEQLKTVTEIDVFETPFDHERGYSIYESDRARLVVFRMDDMESVLRPAMKEFLGIDDFPMRTDNRADDKTYSAVYKEFLERIELTDAYLDRMYNSKMAMHFYMEEERTRFRQRWLRNRKPVLRHIPEPTPV